MIHTLIIWNRALDQKEFILNDLSASFRIYNTYSFNWDNSFFHENLKRFYSHSQYSRRVSSLNRLMTNKMKHCGTGTFLLVVFEDENPQLEVKETSSGPNTVNSNVFNKKAEYRELSGGGHRIHSSDDDFEGNKDLVLLLGLTADEYREANTETPCYDIPMARNVTGVPYYKNINQLFKVLNSAIDYVVLRNFESLPNAYTVAGHGDVDLLVANLNYMKYLTGAQSVFPKEKNRCHFNIIINQEAVPFDFRHIGDNYYDVEWQKDILKTRMLINNSFYVPNEELHFYALLYHALLHKKSISEDYNHRLEGLNNVYNSKNSITESMNILSDFLEKNNYNYTTPIDRSVFFNKANLCLSTYSDINYNQNRKLVSHSIAEVGGTLIATEVYKYNGCYLKRGGTPIIENEFVFLERLKHYPQFPNVLKYSKSQKNSEILIEKVNGKSFHKISSSPKYWKKKHVKATIKGLLQILQILITHEILHRDIRPENILLSKDKNSYYPILIDFGWSVDLNAKNPITPGGLGDAYKYKEGVFSDLYSVGKCFEALFPNFSFLKEPKIILLGSLPVDYKDYKKTLDTLITLNEKLEGLRFSKLDIIKLYAKRMWSWVCSLNADYFLYQL